MWRNSPNLRENYLYFADNNYLAARMLLLNKFYIPGISIAEQSVEQYLKLHAYELFDEETLKSLNIENSHNVIYLFEIIESNMKINSIPLKQQSYYQDLLDLLNKAYKFRYFDKKGLLGELNKSGGVDLTFTIEDLDKFDELCCELRNGFSLGGQGACPVNQSFKDKIFHKLTTVQGEILYTKNKSYGNFKYKNQPMIEFYSRFR